MRCICDSECELRSLSAIYGSVCLMPLHLKTAEGDLRLITEPSLLTRHTCLSHAIYRAALAAILM